ncbi:hypothetical protein MHC_03445 [Mycoplasma haemocanis str. Illinois]|uniref:Uncharacterized protein n=1 Tax=Mycoplasma haemocanis (strain Illinois) TaxID=1111676 RepID=H6N7C7_MYCHN|nr:hypothetical protein [Mycoplasma haemocanis]AEW45549.1 hypothetical protein MHC_03445 [Mycoplasma haemocanis str. Illinois]
MRRSALYLLGIGGIGLSGGVGYLVLRGKGTPQALTKQARNFQNSNEEWEELPRQIWPEGTYGNLYWGIILDATSTPDHIWGYRFSDLKKANPNKPENEPKDVSHPKLVEAISAADEQKAKALHKEACEEIFKTNLKSNGDAKEWGGDMEKYCSHKIKDKFGNKAYQSHDKSWFDKRIKDLSDRNFDVGNFWMIPSNGRDAFSGAWSDVKSNRAIEEQRVEPINQYCTNAWEEAYIGTGEGIFKFELIKAFCSDDEIRS